DTFQGSMVFQMGVYSSFDTDGTQINTDFGAAFLIDYQDGAPGSPASTTFSDYQCVMGKGFNPYGMVNEESMKMAYGSVYCMDLFGDESKYHFIF
ncbi:hypothetical protein PFISCL1PPCAC_28027, partial [Pristionchus fissidentatus]